MSDSKKVPKLLFKQRSWSPDIHRDIEWQKLKIKQQLRYHHHRSKSIDVDAEVEVTDDDVKELKACFDLGFGFDLDSCNTFDPKLAHVFPALELYSAVNLRYNTRFLSRSSSLSSGSSSSSSSVTTSITDLGDDPVKVKTKLKQWAQLVSCSILETSSLKVSKMSEDKNK